MHHILVFQKNSKKTFFTIKQNVRFVVTCHTDPMLKIEILRSNISNVHPVINVALSATYREHLNSRMVQSSRKF